MGERIRKAVAALQGAESVILDVLFEKPLLTKELLEKLDADTTNYALTQLIGDGAGEWDNSPYQLALADLIDDRFLEWWRDEYLEVWYGMIGTKPEHPGEEKVKKLLDYLENWGYEIEGYDGGQFTIMLGEDLEDVAFLEFDKRKGALKLYCEWFNRYLEKKIKWPREDLSLIRLGVEVFEGWFKKQIDREEK